MSVLVYVFLVLNDDFRHRGIGADESYFVWAGWSILKGLAPYRDFVEFKPPFVFLTHALAQKLHGTATLGFRTFFTYFPLSSMIALHLALISRGIDKWLTLALTVACTWLWLNPFFHDTALTDTESIGLTYYLLAVSCLLARTPLGNRLQIAGGAFFVCTVFSKEPFLPCVGMSWISAFLVTRGAGSWKEEARGYALRTISGGLVVLAGLCIYMIPSGSMRAYLEMSSGYARFYRDVARSYCVALGTFHPTVPLNDLHVQWRRARGQFVNFPTIGYLIPFAASIVFMARRSWLLSISVLIGLLAALWAVTASNCQWNHYYNMTMSGVFFALAIGLDSFKPYFWSMHRVTRLFLRILFLGGVYSFMFSHFTKQEELFGLRTTPALKSLETVPGVFAAVAELTKPTDKIVTIGLPFLYIQVDRVAGIRESNFDNEGMGYFVGDTDEERLSGIRAELVASPPKLVILDSYPIAEARQSRFRNALWYPFLHEFGYTEVRPRIWLRPN